MAMVEVMEYVMKWVYARDILPFLRVIKAELEKAAEENFGFIKTIVWYTLERAESENAEKVKRLFEEISPEDKKGEIMSIADTFREEGKRLGRQEGVEFGKEVEKKEIALNMLAVGQSKELIAKVTGLTEEKITELQVANKDKNH